MRYFGGIRSKMWYNKMQKQIWRTVGYNRVQRKYGAQWVIGGTVGYNGVQT